MTLAHNGCKIGLPLRKDAMTFTVTYLHFGRERRMEVWAASASAAKSWAETHLPAEASITSVRKRVAL